MESCEVVHGRGVLLPPHMSSAPLHNRQSHMDHARGCILVIIILF
jgi:hypothetical protein